ncbi:MAG: hypothetical protein AAF950_15600 [Pseudomonadota bacterium]
MRLRHITMMAALPLTFAVPAHAGPLDADRAACEQAFTDATASLAETPDFRFKSSSGNSKRRIQYQTSYQSENYRVRCMVKKGEVSEIRWPDDLEAAIEASLLAASDNGASPATAEAISDAET